MATKLPLCPLCGDLKLLEFQSSEFYRCQNCFFIFKDPKLQLPEEQEKQRYQLHENDINDLKYVAFLSPALEAVLQALPRGSLGLDYGSGPSPVLTELLRQQGYETLAYDPYFSPLDLSQVKDLDFVVSTEVIEHFYSPGLEFKKIFSLIKPQGHVVLMTELYQENQDLTKWVYAKDPTHVSFYSINTFEYLASAWRRKLYTLSPRLVKLSPLC